MEKAKEPDEEAKKIGFWGSFVFWGFLLSFVFVFYLYHSIFLTLNESDPLRV